MDRLANCEQLSVRFALYSTSKIALPDLVNSVKLPHSLYS